MYQLRRLVLVGSPSERRQLILSHLQARSCNCCMLLIVSHPTLFSTRWQARWQTRLYLNRLRDCHLYATFRVCTESTRMHMQAVADALVAKFVDADHVPAAEGNAGARWRIQELNHQLQYVSGGPPRDTSITPSVTADFAPVCQTPRCRQIEWCGRLASVEESCPTPSRVRAG